MLAACGVIHGEVKNLNVQRGNAIDKNAYQGGKGDDTGPNEKKVFTNS